MYWYLLFFILGIIFGWILSNQYFNYQFQKRFKIKWKHKKSIGIKRLSETLRRLVYEFTIENRGNDFLLNVAIDEQIILQVLHRSHFVEFINNVNDISFGMVIYYPYDELDAEQKEKLFGIITEEEPSHSTWTEPSDYVVINAGRRINMTSYLITRIIKEVHGVDDENRVSYELFDEGLLKYREAIKNMESENPYPAKFVSPPTSNK